MYTISILTCNYKKSKEPMLELNVRCSCNMNSEFYSCPSLTEVVLGISSITGALATGTGGGICLVGIASREVITKGGFYQWDLIPITSS